MVKFKKAILIRIISCITVMAFVSGDAAYSMSLRAPIGKSSNRIADVLNRGTYKELKAILFDMDGTLYVNEKLDKLYKEIIYKIVGELSGITIDQARESMKNKAIELKNLKGREVTSEEAASDLGIDMDVFRKRWEEETKKIDVSGYVARDEKLIETFISFKNKYKIAVLTNNSSDQAEKILKALGVRELIDVLVTTTELAGKRKPAQDGFIAIKNALGVEYEEIISIGDKKDIDLAPAEAMGMKMFQVSSHKDLYDFDIEKYWREYAISILLDSELHERIRRFLPKQAEMLNSLKGALEKMAGLGVPLGETGSPLVREILSNTYIVPDDLYVKYIMDKGETKEGCCLRIGEKEIIFINELFYKESPERFCGIFAHETMHLLQRKKVIILGNWETPGIKEVIPQAMGEIMEVLYYPDPKRNVKPDFELGRELYHKYGSYKERLKHIKGRFMEYIQDRYMDEDYIMNADLDIKQYPEDWQRILGTIIAGMAYEMSEKVKEKEYIWRYMYMLATDIVNQTVSPMAAEYTSISEWQRAHLAGDEITYMEGFRNEILPRIRKRYWQKKKSGLPVVTGITGSAASAKTSVTEEFKKELEKEFGQVKTILFDDWLLQASDRKIDPLTGKTTENVFEKFEVDKFVRSIKLFISGNDLLKPVYDQTAKGRIKIGIGDKGEVIVYNGKDLTATIEKDDAVVDGYIFVVRKPNGDILEKGVNVTIGEIQISLFRKKDNEDEFIIKLFDTAHFVGAYKEGGREAAVLDSDKNKVSPMIDPKNGEVLADSGTVLGRGGKPWEMKEYIESKSGVYLVEGILSLYDYPGIPKKERLPYLYDETVFIDADFDVRLERGVSRLKYRTLALKGKEADFKDIDDYADKFSARKHFEDIYIYGTKKDARVKVTTQTRTESIFTLFKYDRLTSAENLSVLRELGIHPYLLEKELKHIAENYIKKSIFLYRDKEKKLSSSQKFEGTAFDVFFIGGDLVVKVPIDKEQFDSEIEPFYEKVLNLRAGGVVAPGVILDISSLGITAKIRGEDRVLDKVLVQNQAEPLRDRLEGFIGTDKIDEAKKLIDEFFELQKKMWEIGILDTDPNIIEKYGMVIENGAERVVSFAIDSLSEDPSLYDPDRYRDMYALLPKGLRTYYKSKIMSKSEFNEKYKKYFIAHRGGKKLPEISHSEVNRSQIEHILKILLKTKVRQTTEIFEKSGEKGIFGGPVWIKLCLDTLTIKNSALQGALEDLYNQLLDYPILVRRYPKDEMIDGLREKHKDLSNIELEQLRMIIDVLYGISGSKGAVWPSRLTDIVGSLEEVNSSL